MNILCSCMIGLHWMMERQAVSQIHVKFYYKHMQFSIKFAVFEENPWWNWPHWFTQTIYTYGLIQDCSVSIVNTREISCTKASIYHCTCTCSKRYYPAFSAILWTWRMNCFWNCLNTRLSCECGTPEINCLRGPSLIDQKPSNFLSQNQVNALIFTVINGWLLLITWFL